MATTKIDIPAGAWTQIMPASATAYCVCDAPFGVKFKQSVGQPVLTDGDCSAAYAGDIISGSAGSAVWARPAGDIAGRVTRHD